MAETVATDPVGNLPASLWKRIRAQPDRAPEHLALAVAERFAPAAERWAEAMLPHHEPRKAARAARAKHGRLARLHGGVTGVGGIVTTVPNVVGLAWLQGRMVFYIAASFGFDPRHPMRPAELLYLWGVYPTAAAAREGLDGVGAHMALQYIDTKASGDRELLTELIRRLPAWAVRRTALRVIPILSAPLSAVAAARSTRELGARAIEYYGGGRPEALGLRP